MPVSFMRVRVVVAVLLAGSYLACAWAQDNTGGDNASISNTEEDRDVALDCRAQCTSFGDSCTEGKKGSGKTKLCTATFAALITLYCVQCIVSTWALWRSTIQTIKVHKELKGRKTVKLWGNGAVLLFCIFKLIVSLINVVMYSTFEPAKAQNTQGSEVRFLTLASNVVLAFENASVFMQILIIVYFWISLIVLSKRMTGGAWIQKLKYLFIGLLSFGTLLELFYRIFVSVSSPSSKAGPLLLITYNMYIIILCVSMSTAVIICAWRVRSKTKHGRQTRARAMTASTPDQQQKRREYTDEITKLVYAVLICAWLLVGISILRVVATLSLGSLWIVSFVYVALADSAKILVSLVNMHTLRPTEPFLMRQASSFALGGRDSLGGRMSSARASVGARDSNSANRSTTGGNAGNTPADAGIAARGGSTGTGGGVGPGVALGRGSVTGSMVKRSPLSEGQGTPAVVTMTPSPAVMSSGLSSTNIGGARTRSPTTDTAGHVAISTQNEVPVERHISTLAEDRDDTGIVDSAIHVDVTSDDDENDGRGSTNPLDANRSASPGWDGDDRSRSSSPGPGSTKDIDSALGGPPSLALVDLVFHNPYGDSSSDGDTASDDDACEKAGSHSDPDSRDV